MKRKVLWAVLGFVVVSATGFAIYKYHRGNYREGGEELSASEEARMQDAYDAKLKDGTCRKREDALKERVETLTRHAHARLKIGTKKDAVVRFFAENNIPVEFYRNEASGIISTTGCSPLGCGTDAVDIRLQMKVDENGSVTSEPEVDGMYTDCL
jgi:hypothetical protein